MSKGGAQAVLGVALLGHLLASVLSGFACGLSGAVIPLTAQQLLQAYPTHDDYVQKYTAAADKALADGYLLQADRDAATEQAKKAPIPK